MLSCGIFLAVFSIESKHTALHSVVVGAVDYSDR